MEDEYYGKVDEGRSNRGRRKWRRKIEVCGRIDEGRRRSRGWRKQRGEIDEKY